LFKYKNLLALKEPNMNNPRRQPGVRLEQPLSALKELNIIVMENISRLV